MEKGIKTLVYNTDRKEDTKKKKISKLLPEPVLRWVIVGSTLAGKSNIIKNILCNKDWGYTKYYDAIYCWIGSTDDKKEYEKHTKTAKRDRIVFIDKYDDDAVGDLYDEIDADNGEKDDPDRILFIFDDQIMNGISNINKFNTMDRLFVAGRHANISVIIATQKYTALNQNMRRLNPTAITAVNGLNINEIEAIASDHCGSYDEKAFKNSILENTKNRYDYITIDLKRDFKERLRNKNFLPIDVKTSVIQRQTPNKISS